MSVNEKMTALADEIRELSGTTATKSIDVMTSDVNTANEKILSQTGLIEQIATAVENKSGEKLSINNTSASAIENNTANLQVILGAVNNLPGTGLSGTFDILDCRVGATLENDCTLYFPIADDGGYVNFYDSNSAISTGSTLIEFSDGTKLYGKDSLGLYLLYEGVEHTIWYAGQYSETAGALYSAGSSFVIIPAGSTIVTNNSSNGWAKAGHFMMSDNTSSGGGVETCFVNFEASTSTLKITMYCVGEGMQLVSPDVMPGNYEVVVKNTIAYITIGMDMMSPIITGKATLLYEGTGISILFIEGDCTITFRGSNDPA